MDAATLKDELSRPGRSQSGLARKLGVDQSAVNRMVNGKREIKARELVEINEYLGDLPDNGASPTIFVVGLRIQGRMDALGLNPYSTATRAGIGEDYIRDIFRGKVRDPGVSRMLKLATALECSLGYLLGIDEAETYDRPPVSMELLGGGKARLSVEPITLSAATALKVAELIGAEIG